MRNTASFFVNVSFLSMLLTALPQYAEYTSRSLESNATFADLPMNQPNNNYMEKGVRWKLLAGLAILLLVPCGYATVRLSMVGKPVERKLAVTGYCKCGECCDWSRDWLGVPICTSGRNKGKIKMVGVTASGTVAGRGTIAADTSRYPIGTMMYVEGYGYGRVEDIGEKITGDHIDVYFKTHGLAQEWGTKKLRVKIWMPCEGR
jgi:3D (Asp-Asp-Asp) domain-containing protein